jgi:hydrogenase large subunit
VPGGCASTLNDRLDAPLKDEPKASDRISLFRELLNRVRDFIANAYLPDVQVLANRFPAYARIGRGPGNLLAFGGFDDPHPDRTPLFRRGTYVDGAIGALDPQDIAESLVSSRYIREGSAPQPTQSVTTPDIDKLNAYTWIKAPRYQSRVFEVGPLARMWIAGHYREGISAMDRIRARAVEAQRLADAMVQWLDDLQIEEATRSRIRYSRSGTGTGMIEAPRGALGHWMAFRQNGITRYQIITPTAWNASPKDESGQPGPMEQAIIGTPVRDRSRPIEVLRVVHSFDPCLACAVH